MEFLEWVASSVLRGPTKEDIDKAIDCGAHFIRIGTNPQKHEIESGFPFLEYAKKQGLIVFMNIMKSYLIQPHAFAENVSECAQRGADGIYLMDSAGGMQPDEVKIYIESTREVCDSPLGFHGHDNLSLAVANSIQAVESGVHFVDATLQGLGRSAGNAILEALASVLQLRGYCTDISTEQLVHAGQTQIATRSKTQAYHALSTLSGRAKVHSALLPTIIRISKDTGITPEALLIEISETDTLDHSQEHLKQLAKAIQGKSS